MATEPLMKTVELAEMLNVSVAALERMKAAGRLPAHIALTKRSHRWRRSEVLKWIEAGCPRPRRR